MTVIIAHRGASAYAPENTMAAFSKAVSLGARLIEFDVMLSADGFPFVFHDDFLFRTTNGHGDFGCVNADYIQTLDAGLWFSKRFKDEKIPSLVDVLTWLRPLDIDVNIEIKPYGYGSTAEATAIAVLTHLNQYWPFHKKLPLISSFDRNALSLCRSLSPELPLGLLMHKWDDQWLKNARMLNCYSIHISTHIAKLSRIRSIKAAGYPVFVYTVNSQRLAKKLIKWEVDAIFSDYPDLLSSDVLSTLDIVAPKLQDAMPNPTKIDNQSISNEI